MRTRGWGFVAATAAGAVALLAAPGAHAALLHDQAPRGYYIVPVVPSGDLPSPSPDYDSQAADDFTVPTAQTWQIEAVEVYGATSERFGSSPGTDTGRVVLYGSGGAVPGSALFEQAGLALEGGTCASPPTANDPTIPCGFTARPSGTPVLTPGTYWVSVQAIAGDYAWEWAVTPPSFTYGLPAVWQNPGGGFSTPCGSFGTLRNCGLTEADEGTDLYLRLYGRVIDSTFTLSVDTITLKGRKLRIPATFPAAGVVKVKGKGVKPDTREVAGGPTKLPVKLKDGVLDALAEGHKKKVRFSVTFTATGGVPFAHRVSLKLIPRRQTPGSFRIQAPASR